MTGCSCSYGSTDKNGTIEIGAEDGSNVENHDDYGDEQNGTSQLPLRLRVSWSLVQCFGFKIHAIFTVFYDDSQIFPFVFHSKKDSNYEMVIDDDDKIEKLNENEYQESEFYETMSDMSSEEDFRGFSPIWQNVRK